MQVLMRVRRIWVFLAMFLWGAASCAATVEIKLASNLVATADYRAGKSSLPAILLLPGFLQTRDAPPISPLANSLADSGYSVLTPTLSLGVSRRNKSLPCEAVHKHTQQDDLREVDLWVKWLNRHGHKRIVMIGHSSGAKDVLAYLSSVPDIRIERAILVAIAASEVDPEQYRKALAQKQASSMPGQLPPLQRFKLAYCKNNYASTVPAYLSYADWNGDLILSSLEKIRVPIDAVLASEDKVVPMALRQQILKSRVPVALIEGAGHFFDGEYEFELNDRISGLLKKPAH